MFVQCPAQGGCGFELQERPVVVRGIFEDDGQIVQSGNLLIFQFQGRHYFKAFFQGGDRVLEFFHPGQDQSPFDQRLGIFFAVGLFNSQDLNEFAGMKIRFRELSGPKGAFPGILMEFGNVLLKRTYFIGNIQGIFEKGKRFQGVLFIERRYPVLDVSGKMLLGKFRGLLGRHAPVAQKHPVAWGSGKGRPLDFPCGFAPIPG